MKVILSRKGFDSCSGGCPSPILPNGTMLSLPIPADESNLGFNDISYDGQTYLDILSQINPKGTYRNCHLDPDIRPNLRTNSIENWVPAFGQTGASQGMLRKAEVEVGDLFLFFGLFHQTEYKNNKLHFLTNKDSSDPYKYRNIHTIYGYMQIGKIITNQDDIKNFSWHPHSSNEHTQNRNNTLYLPTENLSFMPNKSGFGVFDFDEKRILTERGQSVSTWKPYEFLMPSHCYGNSRNLNTDGFLRYGGRWQEKIFYETPELMDWVKSIT